MAYNLGFNSIFHSFFWKEWLNGIQGFSLSKEKNPVSNSHGLPVNS
jgi:hypothetical protein